MRAENVITNELNNSRPQKPGVMESINLRTNKTAKSYSNQGLFSIPGLSPVLSRSDCVHQRLVSIERHQLNRSNDATRLQVPRELVQSSTQIHTGGEKEGRAEIVQKNEIK